MKRRSELFLDERTRQEYARRRMREEVVYAEPQKRASVKITHKSKFDKKRKQTIEDGLAEFNKLVGIPTPDDRDLVAKAGGYGKGRSAYSQTDKAVLAAPTITTRVMVHELGHWLEHNTPDVRQKVFDFYDRRTAGYPLERLRDVTGLNYKSSEVTRRDKFKNAYAGKEYIWKGSRWSTEILSMGIEAIYAEPEKFAAEDPDYFDFIYNLLRGYDV